MSDERVNVEERQKGALLIAASLIAAIRLRGERIDNSPKVIYAISESIDLARMVLERLQTQELIASHSRRAERCP